MSALAFPPAPTLPRTTRSTRGRTRRGPTAPCPHRQRHLRLVPSGLAAPIGRPMPTGLQPAPGAPNVPRSSPAGAPGSIPTDRPTPTPAVAVPAAFMPAPERPRVAEPAPERTRVAAPERPRVARPASEPSVARPIAESARANQSATKSAGAARQVPLRLTARGRLVLVAAAFALAISLGSLAGALFPAQQAMPEQVQDVVVSQGESLWMIASSVAGEGQDVRDVVEQIRALNGLKESTLVTGQTLTIPAG